MSYLVQRLRARACDFIGPDNYLNEAADRIEQLERERDEAIALLKEARGALDDLPGSPHAGRLQDRIDALLARLKG